MSNLFNLVKINFASYLPLNKKDSSLTFFKAFLFLLLYLLIGLFIYRFAKYMINGFHALNMEGLALSEFFAFSSIFILALSIFRMDIFNSKDQDLLRSLPISKKVIITSKLFNIYLYNLLIIIIIMVPCYLAYINIISTSSSFLFNCLISLFIIPIIPTVIAVLINSIITVISANFKYKKAIQTILMLLLSLFSLYFSFHLNSNLELNLLDIKDSFSSFFNRVYPLTKYYTSMLIDNNITSLMIFIGVSFFSIFILIIFLSIFYNKVTNRITVSSLKKVDYNKLSNDNLLLSLIKKDLKRILGSPNYLLNSCLGLLLILILSILLIFFDIDNIENIPINSNTLINYLPLVFLFLILLSSTTSSSISIEGNNFYILKMLPIKFREVWLSKVLCNFLLIVTFCLVSLGIFNLSLDISFKTNLLTILIIICSGLFISIYGLVINLLFPVLSWKSEIKVIKQSAASFITIFSSLLLGIFLAFNDYISSNGYIFYISLSFLIVSVILILFLNTIGNKIYQNMSC